MEEGRVRRIPDVLRVSMAVVTLLGSLGLVTWRQSRALETLARLDELQLETSLAEAERGQLNGAIQALESRVRVVPAARDRLGMHLAATEEMVFLPEVNP
jgi:cell division protein FtsL